MKIRISVQLHDSGFSVRLNAKKHLVYYPSEVWQSVPKELRLQFSEFIATMTTIHLGYLKSNEIQYAFPCPLAFPFFSYGVVLSIPENLVDLGTQKYTTSNLLRTVLNSFYRVSFTGFAHEMPLVQYTPIKKTAIIPFSFGKDSLLTYGVCQKLGITQVPIFFTEPTNIYENNQKQKLIAKFQKEFNKTIVTMTPPLAHLRQTRGFSWGWDIFLTQYTMALIPFLYHYKPEYFFWSNEQNCNEITTDSEGFYVSATFEQTAKWMQIMNTGLRLFGSPTKLGSLLEPLSEFAIIAVLHTAFTQLAAYQTSCVSDHPNTARKRWCGRCYECARVYLYLSALEINPRQLELTDNMFLIKHKKLHYVFQTLKEQRSDLHQQFMYTRYEKLYAFYLNCLRGARHGLLKEFSKRYLQQTKKKLSEYQKRYFSISKSTTVPTELVPEIELLYKQELEKAKARLPIH